MPRQHCFVPRWFVYSYNTTLQPSSLALVSYTYALVKIYFFLGLYDLINCNLCSNFVLRFWYTSYFPFFFFTNGGCRRTQLRVTQESKMQWKGPGVPNTHYYSFYPIDTCYTCNLNAPMKLKILEHQTMHGGWKWWKYMRSVEAGVKLGLWWLVSTFKWENKGQWDKVGLVV